MGMYTDWGNLKIVSCRAWFRGWTQQLNGVPEEWTHWGRPFLRLSVRRASWAP